MPARNQQRFRAELERKKRASVAQLLFKCARLVNERALERVRQGRGLPLRAAHTTLFPHIDMTEGSRLTDLARALGVSKQAVGQLVDELVEMGMLERQPDPDDGRAKRVGYTEAGRRGVFEGLRVLQAEEQLLARAIGKTRFRELHHALLALERVLDGALPEDP